MINRTFACLNRHCMHTFTIADQENPKCVRCSGRTKWLPQSFAIMGEKTKQADRDIKKVREDYGNRNFNSPRRYEPMQPKLNPVPVKGRTRRYEPQSGWAVDVPLDGAGRELSYCAPTGMTSKMKADVGSRVPTHQWSATSHGAKPAFEGVWHPPGGIPR